MPLPNQPHPPRPRSRPLQPAGGTKNLRSPALKRPHPDHSRQYPEWLNWLIGAGKKLWPLLPVFLSTLFFWSYLKQIGRLDLFLLTLTSISGLGSVALILPFIILMGLVALILPSAQILIFYHTSISDLNIEAKRAWINGILWLALGAPFLIALASLKINFWTLIAGPAIAIGLHALWLHYRQQALGKIFSKPEPNGSPIPPRVEWGANIVMYFLNLYIAGVLLIYIPNLITLFLFEFKSTVSYLVSAVILPILYILPAWIYLYCLIIRKKPLKNAIILFAAFIYLPFSAFLLLFTFLSTTLDDLRNKAASQIGLRVETPHRYLLHPTSLDPDFFDPIRWNLLRHPQGFSVEAILPFTLGNLSLLCPADLKDPGTLKARSAHECIILKTEQRQRLPQLHLPQAPEAPEASAPPALPKTP